MSSYLELQDEVLSHQLNDTKYRPYVKQWINEGQRYIVAQTKVRTALDTQAYSTTNGTASYSLPTDFCRIISVRNTTDRVHLSEITQRDYDSLNTASGKPTQYVITGSNLFVYPTPDATYSLELRYYHWPVTLAANGDIPELPEQYHHLLVRYALIRCYQRENDYEAANYQEGAFQNDLMKMRGEVQHDTLEEQGQVMGAWDDEATVSASTWW